MFEGRQVKLKQCRYGPMLFFKNDQYIGKSLDAYGEFSESECSLFREIVSEGSVIVEVGANIGTHTVPLSRLTGPGGKVIAIEAQRRVFNVLCANVALNELENTVCYHMGAGRNRRASWIPAPDFGNEVNIGGLGISDNIGQQRSAAENVSIKPLDDLELERVDFLKIDVEGMELEVLLGAEKLIRASRPIMYVENDRMDQSERLLDFIFQLGYDAWWHKASLFNPANFSNNPDNVFNVELVSVNLLCVPREVQATVNNMDKVTSTHDTAADKLILGAY